MKSILKKFNGAKIKELRKKQRYSQRELSELTRQIDPAGKGIGELGIHRMETGVNVLSANNLALIAAALGTQNFNQFFEDVEIEEPPKRKQQATSTRTKRPRSDMEQMLIDQ